MRVGVIGAGYVGLTTGSCLAYLGHEVVFVDKDTTKVAQLNDGKCPIYEPGLEAILDDIRHNIRFTADVSLVADCEVILIAVGTPPKDNGEADVRFLLEAARECAASFKGGQYYTLVVKSTVPPGTNRWLQEEISAVLAHKPVGSHVSFVSNPEFLREGFALQDSLYPDRIIVGTSDEQGALTLRRLYQSLLDQTFLAPGFVSKPSGYGVPAFVVTDTTSAEMTKYAANAYLALKISFINEIAGLCERVGADVLDVAHGIGQDSRIGNRFLSAGLGWGGSCFPKDTAALVAYASGCGYSMPIVQASRDINERQREAVVEKLQVALKGLQGRTIGILGLAFKPDTDDVREAPALDLIRRLVQRGANVRAHDPVAIPNARAALDGITVEYCATPYEVASGCDAVVLATEWREYRELDLRRLGDVMRGAVLIDGRNIYQTEAVRAAGLMYFGVGR